MATIREVAEHAGVSLATASRVLGSPAGRFPVSHQTSARVRAAAETLGYRINYHMQAVASGRARAIGFCAEVLLEARIGSGAGNLYFDTLRRGVEYTTQEAGDALMSIHPGKGSTALQRGVNFIRERRLDAIVVPASRVVDQLPEAFEKDPSLPLVVINPFHPIRRPSVAFNVQAAMKLVVDHLIGLGHRHLLWVGPESNRPAMESRREELLIQHAWEAGVTGEACRIPVADMGMTISNERLFARVIETLSKRLAQTPRKWTAIAAYSDVYAMGCCDALQAAGLRVPADVSVVGFDDLIASYCRPTLTTIDHCFFEMGQSAGRMAATLVAADAETRQEMLHHVETISPRLIVRQSTGPCPTA